MKKFIIILTLITVLFAFVSCEKNAEKDYPETAPAENSVYENVIFDNLETFTEITGAVLNSTIEEKTAETTFCYVIFEGAEQKITDYKTYLIESGYKMTSSLDDEDLVFESAGKEIVITSEEGESGTSVDITMPCDEETNNARKEKVYKEMLAAAEKKDFKEVFEISDNFSSEEIREYKDVYAYRLFSLAMEAYEVNVYGEARKYFMEYRDEDATDKLGAEAYVKECDSKICKYNGTYSGKSFDGYVSYLMYIKNGRVSLNFNYDEILGNSNKEEAVYYSYDLRVQETDGTDLLYIVDYSQGDINYKQKITQLDSGEMIVNDNAWDVLKGYHNDKSPFAGEYKKISSDTPAEK